MERDRLCRLLEEWALEDLAQNNMYERMQIRHDAALLAKFMGSGASMPGSNPDTEDDLNNV